jgi:hypothetical protein
MKRKNLNSKLFHDNNFSLKNRASAMRFSNRDTDNEKFDTRWNANRSHWDKLNNTRLKLVNSW